VSILLATPYLNSICTVTSLEYDSDIVEPVFCDASLVIALLAKTKDSGLDSQQQLKFYAFDFSLSI